MALISVIVPIYKVEAYLNKCVESIVRQTYTDLEIILVDDGSPDACPQMCDDWAARDSRIKVVHKENGGLSDARNAGLAVATGEYISFIDSDDWIEPEFMEVLLNAINTTGADIADCATRLVSEDGKELSIRGVAENETLDTVSALVRLVSEDRVFQTVWNKLYRRDVIGDILFEKGKYNEDDYFTYQVFDQAEKIAIVSKPMYNYLQRGGSIMGVGYNPRRLEGLQARVLRMEYLQKYPETANLTRQNLVLDCMWHLQSILLHLDGQARTNAKRMVLDILKSVPKVPGKKLTLNTKYKLWYSLFRFAPVTTAKLRNTLKIGP
jgi:glycosyltransferase involved in cell wall biosynthesis